jgi:hypothetical protein
MQIFGFLPESLFQPLAAPEHRQFYARLLLRLYDRLFAARILETPAREDVLRHIEAAIREEGISAPEGLGDDDAEPGESRQAHYVVYRRLRATGWLVEQREKWRVYVEMHPDAFMLLGAIVDLARNSRIRVAGAVVEVMSNLKAAADAPVEFGQGLANAYETAVRFARSMRKVLSKIREIEDRIREKPDAAAIFRTFFDEFVDGILIADYKQLKTANNPYQHRRRISAMARELLYDDEKRRLIAFHYLQQGLMPRGATPADAEDRVIGEPEKIRFVFDDVGEFMDRIDSYKARLERRVELTMHYMDLVGEGSIERIARLIERVSSAAASAERSEVSISLPTPPSGFPITTLALYTPAARRPPPDKTRFRIPPPDPYHKLYVAATTAFDRMVHVSPRQIVAFIDANIGACDSIASADIRVAAIEDLFAYRQLPGAAPPLSAGAIGAYRVVIEDGRTSNEWMDLRAFRVERKEGERRHA